MNNTLSPQDAEAVLDILVEQLGIQKAQLTPDARIHEDLGGDSLEDVEIAMAIEDRFNVTIPDEELENARTVGGLQNILAGLLSKQKSPSLAEKS